MDILGDYSFFGQAYRWQPSEIDNLKWSYRKKLKQAYLDHMNEQKAKKWLEQL
jgi:hypothetical protein